MPAAFDFTAKTQLKEFCYASHKDVNNDSDA